MIAKSSYNDPEYINSLASVLDFLREWDRPQDITINFQIPAEIKDSFARYLAWIQKNKHKESLWPFDDEGGSLSEEILESLADGYIARIVESSRGDIAAIFDISKDQSIGPLNALMEKINIRIEGAFLQHEIDLPIRFRQVVLEYADRHVRTLSTRVLQIQLSALITLLERDQDDFLVVVVQIPERLAGYSDENYTAYVHQMLLEFSRTTEVKLGISDLSDRSRAGGLITAGEKRAKKEFGDFNILVISGMEDFSLPPAGRPNYYPTQITNDFVEIVDHLEANYKSLILVLRGDAGERVFQNMGRLGVNLREKRFDVNFVKIEEAGESSEFKGFSHEDIFY